jgi:G3E family GTPase
MYLNDVEWTRFLEDSAAPLVKTLVSEPVISNHFRLDGVITTVDALNGLGQLEREPESVRQAAAADRLVITKTDVADEADVRALEHRLHALNPLATVLEVCFGEISADDVLGSSGRDPLGLSLEEDVHTNGVRAFSLVLDEPLDWTAFGVWLTMLLQARGADVLRVKGLLDVGASGPVVLNAVQHVVHPPLHLEEWPDEDRRSRLVVIARGLAAGDLERSMLAFSRAGGRPDAPVGSTPRA